MNRTTRTKIKNFFTMGFRIAVFSVFNILLILIILEIKKHF